MTRFEYGDPASANILIQMVDDHDLSVIENEAKAIKAEAGGDFCLVALKVEDWNRDLSPWQAPAVFGNEDFGDGAEETLAGVLAETGDPAKTYYIGGYSLAGLFALWAAYRTNRFLGAAAASPSVWFPGFVKYMGDNTLRADKVYLSLGDREEKTRNKVMATVGECIRAAYRTLCERGVTCTLEWNQGNHFKDPDLRMVKAFAWLLKTK